MRDSYRLGQDLGDFLRGLLSSGDERHGTNAAGSEERPGRHVPVLDNVSAFEKRFFHGEVNRFVGSGGEQLIKGPENCDAPPTRIDVGDRLIGIGIAHYVESLSRPPGPGTFRSFSDNMKMAARAFMVKDKRQVLEGFHFDLAPLSPDEYSALITRVSNGAVRIAPATIPEGTMVISFLDAAPTYSLQTFSNSPAANWERATKGERHWNVGVAGPDDFWEAQFPSDDIAALTQMPSSMKVGTIRFGLSLLSGSHTGSRFQPVPCMRQSGKTSMHQFCLSGHVVGTQGLNTPFPIGLRTEIVFHPAHLVSSQERC